jgi:hypothetical protein
MKNIDIYSYSWANAKPTTELLLQNQQSKKQHC